MNKQNKNEQINTCGNKYMYHSFFFLFVPYLYSKISKRPSARHFKQTRVPQKEQIVSNNFTSAKRPRA